MAEAANLNESFRCPICLFTMRRVEGLGSSTRVRCARCDREFAYGEGLPAGRPKADAVPDQLADVETGSSITGWLLLAVGLGLSLLGCVLARVYGKEIRGPRFLFAYTGLLLGVTIGQWLIRHNWRNTMTVSVVALLLFESIGVTRLLTGYYLFGMHKFEFLILLMVIGGIIQLVRVDSLGNVWGSSWGASGCGSSCSSGCGGGCGGGGCGGCGS